MMPAWPCRVIPNPEGFQPLAGGQRSATTGWWSGREPHPGGMPPWPCRVIPNPEGFQPLAGGQRAPPVGGPGVNQRHHRLAGPGVNRIPEGCRRGRVA